MAIGPGGAAGGLPRQGILSLAIKDKGALYNAYMPFVKGGGLFVPTAKRYNLGDEEYFEFAHPVFATPGADRNYRVTVNYLF